MAAMQTRNHEPSFARCPRCGQDSLRTDQTQLNAVSRTDNITRICSPCGLEEAIEAFTTGTSNLTKDGWAHAIR